MVLFVLDNEPQPQEERETEAMELENFTDVSSSFCCKTSLFFGGGGGGGSGTLPYQMGPNVYQCCHSFNLFKDVKVADTMVLGCDPKLYGK